MRASSFGEKKIEVLRAIDDRSHTTPSVRELAELFGVGTATMHSWLSKLSNEELVVWEPGRHRSLRLTQAGVLESSRPAVQSV